MKNIYKHHKSEIFNYDANIISLIMYVPSYILLFVSWYVAIPEIVSWVVSLIPILALLKEKSPLVRFHATNAVLINFGLVLFLNLFYLMLLGYQIHNSDWGSLAYGYVNYFVMLLVYIMPAYYMVKAYKYSIGNISFITKVVNKISKFEDYNRNLLIGGRNRGKSK